MLKKVYISYKWGGEGEDIANEFEKAVKYENFKFIRDKRELKYKDNIKDFMNILALSDYIVVVVNKDYLESDNCMYELLTIYENGKFRSSIYPIILSDANIYKPSDRLKYKRFWKNEVEEYYSVLSEFSPNEIVDEAEDILLYEKIKQNFSKISDVLKNINSLRSIDHKENNFKDIIDAINSTFLEKNNKQEYYASKQYHLDSISEIRTIKGLSLWMNKNKDKLINGILDKLLIKKHEYFTNELTSEDTIKRFTQSINEHFDWMLACYNAMSSKIPLNDYVNEIDIIVKAPKAYSHFFQLFSYEINNNDNDLTELQKKTLLNFSEYLSENY